VGPDRTLEERAVGSFLLGLKKQLVEWGFGRGEVRVDLDKVPSTLEVGKREEGRREVLAAAVRAGELKLTWTDPTWGAWSDLVSSAEFKGLMSQAKDKLSKGSGSKGMGKGKEKGKGW